MSFRKRNVGLASTRSVVDSEKASVIQKPRLPGIRPSPLDGRPTTSTGTSTLDELLAGHAGLCTGCSLLIEENGTTEYAGALLRFYAAEGLLQGHHVHVVGLPEHWGRDLPGVAKESEDKRKTSDTQEKMRIAWRYESLGQFGTNTKGREPSIPETNPKDRPLIQFGAESEKFCHTFDLTKRLVHPASSKLTFVQFDANPAQPPFASVSEKLKHTIANTSSDSVHRIIIPSFLSPALYPPQANLPSAALSFLHGIKALLATYQGRLTAMLSLPLSLYPRSTGLVRWIENLCDGTFELVPFPHSAEYMDQNLNESGQREEPPQGLLRVHKSPIYHECGVGTGTATDDWTFTLGRKRFAIKPFNLPPVEGDTEAQQAASSDDKKKRTELEF